MNTNEYFDQHSLNSDFLRNNFGVTWTEDTITIPIYDSNGVFLFNKRRLLNSTEKYKFAEGSHPVLFCANMVAKFDNVVLTEGEMDCMRLWQDEIPATTAGGVSAFSGEMALLLKGKTIYICLDTDTAGVNSVIKYWDLLVSAEAKPEIVLLPASYKDVCEYFTDGHSRDDFLSLPHQTKEEWFADHVPDEYKFEEGTEILLLELPPDEWLIDRVLPAEGFAFIVGAEATGKSFYTLTMAYAVSTGTKWLGQFIVKTPQKVLIIDKENTKRRIQSRMKGLGMSGKDIFWLKYPVKFDLTDPKSTSGFSLIAETASKVVKKRGIKFIIVDSFADIMVGNENAAGDVQMFFDGFRQLFPDCSILVLHHASKPAQGTPRTSAQKARGSTNIMAQIYSGFYVTAVPKSKTEFVLEQTKSGDAEKLNKFKVGLVVESDPLQIGKTVVKELQYLGEVDDEELKMEEAILLIQEALKDVGFISRQDTLDLLSTNEISAGTADRAIGILTDKKIIKSTKDPADGRKRNYVLCSDKAYEE